MSFFLPYLKPRPTTRQASTTTTTTTTTTKPGAGVAGAELFGGAVRRRARGRGRAGGPLDGRRATGRARGRTRGRTRGHYPALQPHRHGKTRTTHYLLLVNLSMSKANHSRVPSLIPRNLPLALSQSAGPALKPHRLGARGDERSCSKEGVGWEGQGKMGRGKGWGKRSQVRMGMGGGDATRRRLPRRGT